MTLDDLRSAKRDAMLRIAARHGVTRIRVFGSFARGEVREDSDLDLLIDYSAKRTPFFPGGFLYELERELGRKVDVTTEAALDPLIREEILREALPL